MDKQLFYWLRSIAASLMTISGIAHIAVLWFAAISPRILISTLFGAVYLLVALGLFGRSRFALFTGIVIPGGAVALTLTHLSYDALSPLLQWLLVTDSIAALLCLAVLFKLRNTPSD